MKREVRTFKASELRAKADGKSGAAGYAAVFNSVTDLGYFKEVIKPGAFTRALNEKQDVRCLLNHDPNMVLGRTKSGTLALSQDDKGLRFDVEFPDTQVARDLNTLLERGDIDACSFGFRVLAQTWREERQADGSMIETREVEDVDLFDVTIATYPAYEDTTVAARSLWPDGMPSEVEVRSQRVPIAKRDAADVDGDNDKDEVSMCQCDCAGCTDGDCADCMRQECADPMCRCMTRTDPQDSEQREKKTKRVDGEDLRADSFLIVGNPEDTSTWKLPWKFSTEDKTKSHLRNALARINQLKGVSAEEKVSAKTNLVKLCKEHGLDVEEENSAAVEGHEHREETQPVTETESSETEARTEPELTDPPAVQTITDEERLQARLRAIRATL